MVNVLILKNIAIEGPGTIEDFLKSRGLNYSIFEFHKGQVPQEPDLFSHLVVMGGPMAVYEMDRYPFLKGEAKLIENFIKKDKAVLGICLGAQMLAHVLGARVYPGPQQEIGWFMVQLTEEAMKDKTMAALEIEDTRQAEVFQWHGDTFDLPSGAKRLAYSDIYENQAFLYGNNIYGLQFHIEVTPDILAGWFGKEGQDYVQHAQEIFQKYLKRAMKFYENFFLTN